MEDLTLILLIGDEAEMSVDSLSIDSVTTTGRIGAIRAVVTRTCRLYVSDMRHDMDQQKLYSALVYLL